MQLKVDGKLSPNERKIFLYSGHENNVLNIQAALKVFRPHIPKYSAATIIELHYLIELQKYAVRVRNPEMFTFIKLQLHPRRKKLEIVKNLKNVHFFQIKLRYEWK